MSELGQFLKEKRKEKKISLETLQEKTKIRKRYIEAIENGEYHILPGSFYARAFIKSYADAIGLKGEDIIEQYSREMPDIPKAPVETTTPTRKAKSVKTLSPKFGKWVSRLVLYTFLFVILFSIYFAVVHWGGERDQTIDLQPGEGPIGHGELDPREEEGTEDYPSEGETTDEGPAIVERDSVEPEWEHLETSGTTLTYAYRNAERFELTIQANQGDVWIRLSDIDQNQTIEAPTIGEGTERTWDLTDRRNILVRFGHLRGKTVLINGSVIDLSEIENEGSSYNVVIQFEPLDVSTEE